MKNKGEKIPVVITIPSLHKGINWVIPLLKKIIDGSVQEMNMLSSVH